MLVGGMATLAPVAGPSGCVAVDGFVVCDEHLNRLPTQRARPNSGQAATAQRRGRGRRPKRRLMLCGSFAMSRVLVCFLGLASMSDFGSRMGAATLGQAALDAVIVTLRRSLTWANAVTWPVRPTAH